MKVAKDLELNVDKFYEESDAEESDDGN